MSLIFLLWKTFCRSICIFALWRVNGEVIPLLDVSVNTREPSPCVPKKGALTKSDIDDIIEHVKKYYPEL